MVKNHLLGLLSIALLLTPLSCKPGPQVPMRIGTNTWPGYEPMYLARDLSFIDAEKIRLVRFGSSTETIAAFSKKEVDAAAITLDEALSLAEFDSGISIILVTDISAGADALLGRREIKDLSGLRGRRIGVETTAVGEYMLHRMLERADMTDKDMTVEHITVDKHEAAFMADKVDAVITFEPVRSRLLKAGAHILFDSSLIPDEIFDVVLVRNDYLKSHPDVVKRFLDGWFRALAYMKERQTDAAERMKEGLGLSALEVIEAYKGLKLPDREENRRFLTGQRPLIQDAAVRIQDVMIKNRLLHKHVDTAALLDRQRLERLYR